jgi:DNA-binding IclR family transcriptional regulator
MHTSLSDRIERYLKSNAGTWKNGGEIERLAMGIGYKASNASRRCRELVQNGTLERKEEKGSVWYRAPIKNLQTNSV